jgi:hypothetical protein
MEIFKCDRKKKIGDIYTVLAFLFHILISLIVLGISILSVGTVKFKNNKLKILSTTCSSIGIILVGIGIFIGGGDSLHAYIYITFIIQLIILILFLLLNLFNNKVEYSKIKSISSICLITISLILYIYYIIASFIYF